MSVKRIHLDAVSTVTAYDTSAPANGAPGKIGEIREYDDPTYGHRLYRLVRNATGASIGIGSVCKYVSGSTETVAPGTAQHPAPNIAGVAVAAVATGNWFWLVCEGKVPAAGDGTAGVAGDVIVPVVGVATIGYFKPVTVATAGEAVAAIGTLTEASGAAGVVKVVDLSGLV